MTWREFGVLVDGLPPESLTHTALRVEYEHTQAELTDEELEAQGEDFTEPGDAPWTKSDQLIAKLIDCVNWNTYAIQQLIAVQTEGTKEPPEPEPEPRPGVRLYKHVKREDNEFDAAFAKWWKDRGNGIYYDPPVQFEQTRAFHKNRGREVEDTTE